jgi:hypothetical protein
MITEFVPEAGARKIRAEHQAYSMVLFPQESLHLEFNPDCEEMIFVAASTMKTPESTPLPKHCSSSTTTLPV